ncbi:maleylpyruvate isomerase N-terminal domain-containing protein [Streptomyces sp. NPDC026206]|uniref:maleylpyruvate isomerase N-terminal domain-containing protein n=1 Tax=Streptomyces sp. NPDC026206 TaxID=3157089 RepID=UPI0033EC7411
MIAAVRGAPEASWQNRAGSLEWDCRETVEHLADDMFCYAMQLAPPEPPLDGYVPVLQARLRPGGPEETIHAERGAGLAGLFQVLEASTGLLAAMVRTKPPQTRAFHSYGVSDPEGFAAMGVVEALVHAHDVAAGLGVTWEPPAALCERTLARLFPDAPTGADPWPTLLWATGRTELPGHPRRASWRWRSAPQD